jgi:hypothetical protein
VSEGVTRSALEAAFNGRLPRAYLDFLERHSITPGQLAGVPPANGNVSFLSAEHLLAALEGEGAPGRRTLPAVVPFASDGQGTEQAPTDDADLIESLRALTRRHPRAHYAFDLTRPGPPVVRLQLDKNVAEEVAPDFAQFLKGLEGGGKPQAKAKR